MKKRLKINGIIIFLAFLFLVLFPAAFLRIGQTDISLLVTQACGITLIILGQLLRASARGYKSEHSQGGHFLIQGGPYIFTRNPMYLGILLIGMGIVSMLFKWWVALLFLPIFILRYVFLVYEEEKKLSALFGESYRDYQKRVPRLLPRVSLIMHKEMAEYLPLKPLWIKRELGSILAILMSALFFSGWADAMRAGPGMYLRILPLILGMVIIFIFTVAHIIKKTRAF